MGRTLGALVGLVALLGSAAACGGDDDDDSGAGGSAAAAGSAASAQGGSENFGNANPNAQPAHPSERDSGILPDVGGCGHLEVRNLDLLFMVDNSGSMKEEAVDFEDAATVTAFYDRILAAPEMIETVDDVSTPSPEDDRLTPSCTNGLAGRASPPRRIVEVAKQFGKNGIVQSICQDDFGPAIDAIVLAITRAQKSACVVM
jgi:hypothetical protein